MVWCHSYGHTFKPSNILYKNPYNTFVHTTAQQLVQQLKHYLHTVNGIPHLFDPLLAILLQEFFLELVKLRFQLGHECIFLHLFLLIVALSIYCNF